MGSYAELHINNICVYSEKNYFDSSIAFIFNEEDKIQGPLEKLIKDFAPVYEQYIKYNYSEADLQDFETYPEFTIYCIQTKILKKRLSILGYTLNKIKNEFNEGKLEVIKLTKESLKNLLPEMEEMRDYYETKINILNNTSFDDLITDWKKICEADLYKKIKFEIIRKEGSYEEIINSQKDLTINQKFLLKDIFGLLGAGFTDIFSTPLS